MPYDGGIGHGIAIFVTRQDGPLVEAESIHVHLFDPEFQAIRNQLIDKGMVAFEGIAGATIIEIILFIVWHKQIIGTVIYAPVTDGRTQFIAFACVIEDDIQNDPMPALCKALTISRKSLMWLHSPGVRQ